MLAKQTKSIDPAIGFSNTTETGYQTHILVIEDDPGIRSMVSMTLRNFGYRASEFEDGNKAIKILQEATVRNRPDLILLDLMMPGLDGYQLVRALRGDPETAQIPLVLLTALAEDTQQFVGLASGADQYLTKPASPQAIVATIQQVITLTQAERARALQHLVEDEQGAP